MEEKKAFCPILSKREAAGFALACKKTAPGTSRSWKKCSVLVIAKELEEHAVEVLRDL